MKYAVVTGASKGLGASISKRLVQEKIGLISVSRSENNELKKLYEEAGLFYQHVRCDLADRKSTENAFDSIAETVFSNPENEVFLVNNAGVVEPIEKVGNLDSNLIETAIQVNLAAPMYTTNLFIQKAGNVKLTIVNVNSGAAERPVQGWSTYCSTKAALNMFTKTVALEQEQSPITIFGLSPGIMDTEMQEVIRSSSEEAFQEVNKFISYKESGMLRSTEVVADCLVGLMVSNEIQAGKVYSITNLLK